MRSRILYGWNIQRILFLIAGGFVLIQSIMAVEWIGIIMGGYFAAMGILGFGCASGSCYNPNTSRPTDYKLNNEVEYEEIKNIKESKNE